MSERRCRQCQQLFQASRFHPHQIVCARPDCRRHHRREYHRRKIETDPEYHQVCRDSQQKWRAPPSGLYPAVPASLPAFCGAQPASSAPTRPAAPSAESCKEHLSFGPKAFRCRGLAAGAARPGSCKEQLGFFPSPDSSNSSLWLCSPAGVLKRDVGSVVEARRADDHDTEAVRCQVQGPTGDRGDRGREDAESTGITLQSASGAGGPMAPGRRPSSWKRFL